tara:strand:+ start:1724 stop:2149 length:426 start_codon:yes stop_codon:yes gene_type:complete
MGSVDDIKLFDLTEIKVEGGNIIKILNKDDSHFKGFGEIYFSNVDHKKIKAWKFHKHMHLNLFVFRGKIKFVFFDENSVLDVVSSEDNYQLIHVPPRIWFGFQGLDTGTNTLLNIADIRHDMNEIERKDLKEINFDWGTEI